jgi:tetratricopeptide (TPR) repeat protein
MTQAPLWQREASASTWCKLHGDVQQAIEHMLRAIELLEAASDSPWQVSIYWNALADLYFLAEEWEKAEGAIRTALARSEAEGSVVRGDNWLLLAAILEQQGQTEEARRCAKQAQAIYAEWGHSHGVAQAEARLVTLEKRECGGLDDLP